jgi:hypothetical protein
MINFEPHRYVVHSKKNGNEFSISFSSIDHVTDYVKNEPNVLGVYRVSTVKVPEGVYTRKEGTKSKSSDNDS